MAKPQRRELPHERENRKVTEILWKLMDLYGADSPHNLLQKATSALNELHAEKEKYEALVATLCSETDTANIGRFFDRLRKWKRQSTSETLADRYNLDTSFLRKNSTAWATSIVLDDENWESQKLAWDKKREKRREASAVMYENYLDELYEACQDESLTESETEKHLNLGHDQFKEDYCSLPFKDLFTKYNEDVNVTLEIIERTSTVSFSECLEFVKDFAPRQLYKELSSSASTLGEISKTQFEKWDAKFAEYSQEPAKDGVPKLRNLMRKITGGMVYRLLKNESGWPTPLEESKLEMLLSTPEENAASADWEIDDATTLLQFAKHFEQLTGTAQ